MSRLLSPAARRARSERGAAAVEFAIILPILLLLVLGIFVFALGFNAKQGLQAAAREGARVGSLTTGTTQDIQCRVQDALSGVPLDGTPQMRINGGAWVNVPPGGSCPGGATSGPCMTTPAASAVTVEVKGNISNPFSGFIPGGATVSVTGKASFSCE